MKKFCGVQVQSPYFVLKTSSKKNFNFLIVVYVVVASLLGSFLPLKTTGIWRDGTFFYRLFSIFSEQTGGLVLLEENFMETLSADW